MFYASFHKLVFPMVLVTVVGSVWVAAWSQSVQAEAEQNSWPALPVPNHHNQTASSVETSTQDDSLQQVLLKHN